MLTSTKKHFIIEGNIGAGKSTFLRLMNTYLSIHPVFEPHEKWQKVQGGENLLEKFYQDIHRWAYTFQTYAFVSRVLEQQQAEQQATEEAIVIERSVYSDRYCFAKNCFEMGVMSGLEWELYKEWFGWLVESYTVKPAGFIYLRTEPEVSYNRMHIRQRNEESSVSLDYITKLHQKHEDWLMHKFDIASYLQDVPVLVLDCNKEFEHDLEEQKRHMNTIAEFFQIPLKHAQKNLKNDSYSLVK